MRNLVGIAGKPHNKTVVACIGPQTAATAREFGLRVDVQPETANVASLIDMLGARRPSRWTGAPEEDRRADSQAVSVLPSRTVIRPVKRSASPRRATSN
ncbi:MAG TPA: uroporphyrinogen-III synthase [Jatrophihabitans sp.]